MHCDLFYVGRMELQWNFLPILVGMHVFFENPKSWELYVFGSESKSYPRSIHLFGSISRTSLLPRDLPSFVSILLLIKIQLTTDEEVGTF